MLEEDEWIFKTTGMQHHSGMGNAPKWFRKILNRKQRRQEQRVLNRAFLNDDWDDLLLPIKRRNANWLWW